MPERATRIQGNVQRGVLHGTRSRGRARTASMWCVAVGVFVSTGAVPAQAKPSIPVIAMVAQHDTAFPAAYPIFDRLPQSGVVAVHVGGFAEFERAVAEQCVTGDRHFCANPIPVQFNKHGEAQFQYLVDNAFLPSLAATGGCRAHAGRCTISVRSIDGRRRSEVQTIFIDAAPPAGRIEVTPSTGLSLDGETVTVRVRNFPPGATAQAMLCAAPSAVGENCGPPGAVADIAIRPDGTGEARLFVAPGKVGVDQVRCFRDSTCGVSVASAAVFARAPVVPISFDGPVGARYNAAQLILWLSVAALLIAVAAWLLLRTDWSTVGEAAAPEIDNAEYADLDAIIAALPPDDEQIVSANPSRASYRV